MDPMTGLPQPGNGAAPPPNLGGQGGQPMPNPMQPAQPNPMSMIINMMLQKLMQGGMGAGGGMSGLAGGDNLGTQPGMPPAQGPGNAPWNQRLQTGLPQPAGQLRAQGLSLGGVPVDQIGKGPPPKGYTSWEEWSLDNPGADKY